MSERWTRAALRPVVQTLSGGLVVFLTVPTGTGPVAGGCIAGEPDGEIRSDREKVSN
jgi:hypothetical protein